MRECSMMESTRIASTELGQNTAAALRAEVLLDWYAATARDFRGAAVEFRPGVSWSAR